MELTFACNRPVRPLQWSEEHVEAALEQVKRIPCVRDVYRPKRGDETLPPLQQVSSQDVM